MFTLNNSIISIYNSRQSSYNDHDGTTLQFFNKQYRGLYYLCSSGSTGRVRSTRVPGVLLVVGYAKYASKENTAMHTV
jgi:hypothetical protein